MLIRQEITAEHLLEAMRVFEAELLRRIEQHGNGTFVSHHEILGIMTEEYKELTEAVQANDLVQVSKELMDLAVPAVFGYACIFAGYVEGK